MNEPAKHFVTFRNIEENVIFFIQENRPGKQVDTPECRLKQETLSHCIEIEIERWSWACFKIIRVWGFRIESDENNFLNLVVSHAHGSDSIRLRNLLEWLWNVSQKHPPLTAGHSWGSKESNLISCDFCHPHWRKAIMMMPGCMFKWINKIILPERGLMTAGT